MTKKIKFMGHQVPVIDEEYFLDNSVQPRFKTEYLQGPVTTARKKPELDQDKMTKEEYLEMFEAIRETFNCNNIKVGEHQPLRVEHKNFPALLLTH